MNTRRAYLFWVFACEAIAPPFTQSPPLLCEIIKVVSNGRGPSLLAEVIFAAINPLGWCIVGAIVLSSLNCLLLLPARALVVVRPGDGSWEVPL